MKALLLATAMIAAPLIAQSDTGTSITTKPATSKSADKPLQDPAIPTAKDVAQPVGTSITTRSSTSDMSAPDQAPPPPPADPSAPPPPPPPPGGPDTAAAPPPPPPAGSGQVVFQQPPSVEQAFPPPAAKESYPVCSRTVTDGCRQRRDPK